MQDLAACWEDHNLPPDQPPTPRPLPDSDTDSDSGRAESSFPDYGPAELAECAIPLPGTPMAPAIGPVHKRAARWLRKKWKKGLLLGAYLGKELKEQVVAFRSDIIPLVEQVDLTCLILMKADCVIVNPDIFGNFEVIRIQLVSWCSRLSHSPNTRKVSGSIPDETICFGISPTPPAGVLYVVR